MRKLAAILALAASLALPAAVSADTWTTVGVDHCTGPTGFSAHLLFMPRNATPPAVGSHVNAYGDDCIVAGVVTKPSR